MLALNVSAGLKSLSIATLKCGLFYAIMLAKKRRLNSMQMLGYLLVMRLISIGFASELLFYPWGDPQDQDHTNITIKGRYYNYDYAYSVTIPNGLVGFR